MPDETITGKTMSDELAAVSPSKKTIIEDLARRSTHGDREALLQLCQIIARDILFKVMRKLPNRMDAEDVAQEVLIRVCSRIHELRDPKSFPYWLNSIVKNETNRYLTVTVKEAPVLDIREYLNSAEEESADLLPQEHISRKEDSEAVMQIVDTLPERQLEAIMLHYYDGMSVTETAKAMGVTKQGASRYLSLARDKIRRGLENRAASQTNIDNSHAAVPFGILITQAMQVGASQVLPDSSPWMTQVLDKCLEYAFVVGAGTLASAFSLKKIIAATLSVSTAITTIAVAVIMLSPPAVDNKDAAAIGTVVFDGGEAGYDYLNPKHASPLTDSIYGELTVLDWRITSLDGAVTYYSGQGNDADDALRQLLVDGSDGEYLLVYTLEDETGSTYSLSHSFSIRREH